MRLGNKSEGEKEREKPVLEKDWGTGQLTRIRMQNQDTTVDQSMWRFIHCNLGESAWSL